MRRVLSVAVVAALSGCAEDGAEHAASAAASDHGGSGGTGAAGGSTAQGGTAAQGGGLETPSVTTEVVTSSHRFDDPEMFGGWGGHLGHLVRLGTGAGGELWLVDDICSQDGVGLPLCDVLDNYGLGYFRLGPSGWVLEHSVELPGQVQQNTATIGSADGTKLHTFGIDVAAGQLVECTLTAGGAAPLCGPLPFNLVASSNYIGAALSPTGARLVWWTGVVNDGPGSFHYIADYGQGWNGPRSGDAGGYNDASYALAAFRTDSSAFSLHAELVAGKAPSWTYAGGVGAGDLSITAPVVWSTPLAPAGADPVQSTNDLWIDPITQDTHLCALTASGALAYYFRASGGEWQPASFVLPQTLRARLVLVGDALNLVTGTSGEGLALRVARAADRVAGAPVDWASIAPLPLPLPAGYEQILAIFPAAPPYQAAAATTLDLAIVGAARQNELLGVHVGW